jgi:hypothetical protein
MPAYIRHGTNWSPYQGQTRTHNIHEVSLAALSSALAHSRSMSSTDRCFARHGPVEDLHSPHLDVTSPLLRPSGTCRPGPGAASGCTADRTERDSYIHDNARKCDDTRR